MILTHLLVLVALPPVPVAPAPGRLPLDAGQALVSGGRLELALLPALPVRAAAAVLAIRER